jgi:hypothetical protein
MAREYVIDTLTELFAMRGVPRHIRSDNGPEFIAEVFGVGQSNLESRRSISSRVLPGERLCRELPQQVAMSSWPWSSRTWLRHGSSQPLGERITTTTGRTARWGTSLRWSSRLAAVLPFGLRPHSRTAANLPNPYSHSTWYTKWGQVTLFL